MTTEPRRSVEDLKAYDPVRARTYTDRSMWLPEGRTCKDCSRFAGCVRFFGCRAEAVTCDWSPSAFHSRDPLVPGAKAPQADDQETLGK